MPQDIKISFSDVNGSRLKISKLEEDQPDFVDVRTRFYPEAQIKKDIAVALYKRGALPLNLGATG